MEGTLGTIGWIFICVLCLLAGAWIVAVKANRTIAELKLWNRRLQNERDEAMKDAKNYRELLKIEQ